jgi:hypothetical protein
LRFFSCELVEGKGKAIAAVKRLSVISSRKSRRWKSSLGEGEVLEGMKTMRILLIPTSNAEKKTVLEFALITSSSSSSPSDEALLSTEHHKEIVQIRA